MENLRGVEYGGILLRVEPVEEQDVLALAFLDVVYACVRVAVRESLELDAWLRHFREIGAYEKHDYLLE
jgi:hypothetical protein